MMLDFGKAGKWSKDTFNANIILDLGRQGTVDNYFPPAPILKHIWQLEDELWYEGNVKAKKYTVRELEKVLDERAQKKQEIQKLKDNCQKLFNKKEILCFKKWLWLTEQLGYKYRRKK